MKKTLLALIALTALAAACHEQRQDDEVRAAAGDSQLELQRQTPPPANQAY